MYTVIWTALKTSSIKNIRIQIRCRRLFEMVEECHTTDAKQNQHSIDADYAYPVYASPPTRRRSGEVHGFVLCGERCRYRVIALQIKDSSAIEPRVIVLQLIAVTVPLADPYGTKIF